MREIERHEERKVETIWERKKTKRREKAKEGGRGRGRGGSLQDSIEPK